VAQGMRRAASACSRSRISRNRSRSHASASCSWAASERHVEPGAGSARGSLPRRLGRGAAAADIRAAHEPRLCRLRDREPRCCSPFGCPDEALARPVFGKEETEIAIRRLERLRHLLRATARCSVSLDVTRVTARGARRERWLGVTAHAGLLPSRARAPLHRASSRVTRRGWGVGGRLAGSEIALPHRAPPVFAVRVCDLFARRRVAPPHGQEAPRERGRNERTS